jgi:hypothetical protein
MPVGETGKRKGSSPDNAGSLAYRDCPRGGHGVLTSYALRSAPSIPHNRTRFPVPQALFSVPTLP